MRIYAIRHGLTGMNKQGIVNAEIDEPLAPEGKEQAQQAAKSLPKSIRHIYVSPQKRAVQTAKILGSHSSLPISKDSGLSEIRMGALAGKSWTDMPNGAELKDLHRTVRFDYSPHGGESLKTVIDRVKNFIKTIEAKHANDEVLIVTHGGIMRILHFLESKKVIYDTEKNVKVLAFDTDKILAKED